MLAALLILGSVLVVGLLALRYGVDSRSLDTRDRRVWWPGHHS
jgi:hypothetical protein